SHLHRRRSHAIASMQWCVGIWTCLPATAEGLGRRRDDPLRSILPAVRRRLTLEGMDKRFLIEQLTDHLLASAHVARRAGPGAGGEAREGGTPAEKREDARVALEQGSLARGQAERAKRAAAEVSVLEVFRPAPLRSGSPVALGAVVEVEDGEQGRTFFLA